MERIKKFTESIEEIENTVINFDRDNGTLLMSAVYDNKSYETIEKLVYEKKAETGERKFYLEKILFFAVYFRLSYDIIKLLIDQGAIVSDFEVRTAIYRSVPDNVSMLLIDNIKKLNIFAWIESYCKSQNEFVLSVELYEAILKKGYTYTYTRFNFNWKKEEKYQTMMFFEVIYIYPSIKMIEIFRKNGLDIVNCTGDDILGTLDILGLRITDIDIKDEIFINLIDYLIHELGINLNEHRKRGRFIEKIINDQSNPDGPFLRADVLKYLFEHGSTVGGVGDTVIGGVIGGDITTNLLVYDYNSIEIMELFKEHGANYNNKPKYLLNVIEGNAKEDILEYIVSHGNTLDKVHKKFGINPLDLCNLDQLKYFYKTDPTAFTPLDI